MYKICTTMISKQAAWMIFIFSCSVAFSQNPEKPKKTFTASISKRDTTIKADVLSDRSDFSANANLSYYWFSSNRILETKGGYDGRLLHGSYTSFYGNKNLRQKGKFGKGLKKGKWISWYSDGRINEVSHWKKGMKNGKFLLYSTEGKLMLVTNFTNDKLNGKMISFENGKKLSERKYKNGEEVLPKELRPGKIKEIHPKGKPASSKISFKDKLKRWFGPKEKEPAEKPKDKQKKHKEVTQS